jgi:hypothetical protein
MLDCRCRNQCVGQPDRPLDACGSTIGYQACPGIHDGLGDRDGISASCKSECLGPARPFVIVSGHEDAKLELPKGDYRNGDLMR